MITLLTGVPGSGKTLFAVSLAEKYLKEGRNVYSDIEDYLAPLSAPDDWRECPAGSVVIYDECQKRFPATGRGRSKDEVITAMEEHRHRGIDLILISQRPNKIHHDVRGVVGLHHHFLRVYGLERAKIFTKDSLIADTLSAAQLRECDQRFWNFPKNLYNFYKSAEVHTHKAYMPRFVRNTLIIIVLALLAFGYFFRSSFHFFATKKPASDLVTYSTESLPGQGLDVKPSVPAQSSSSEPYVLQPITVHPLDPHYLKSLAACMRTATGCVCYDEDYFRIHQTYLQCSKMLASLPVYVRRSPPPAPALDPGSAVASPPAKPASPSASDKPASVAVSPPA